MIDEETKECYKAFKVLQKIASSRMELKPENLSERKYSYVRAVIYYILHRCEEFNYETISDATGERKLTAGSLSRRFDAMLDEPVQHPKEMEMYNYLMDEYYGK